MSNASGRVMLGFFIMVQENRLRLCDVFDGTGEKGDVDPLLVYMEEQLGLEANPEARRVADEVSFEPLPDDEETRSMRAFIAETLSRLNP